MQIQNAIGTLDPRWSLEGGAAMPEAIRMQNPYWSSLLAVELAFELLVMADDKEKYMVMVEIMEECQGELEGIALRTAGLKTEERPGQIRQRHAEE